MLEAAVPSRSIVRVVLPSNENVAWVRSRGVPPPFGTIVKFAGSLSPRAPGCWLNSITTTSLFSPETVVKADPTPKAKSVASSATMGASSTGNRWLPARSVTPRMSMKSVPATTPKG